MRLVHYDFQQCIMLHIALGNNVATGYKVYSNISLTIEPHTDVRNKYNRTPLHKACEEGHIQLVKYLVEEGRCDVGE